MAPIIFAFRPAHFRTAPSVLIAVALLAALNPIAVLPAGLFFGFLEAGALAMQREVGVQSSLVYVIQGLTMVLVLCALATNSKQQRV